MGEDVIQFTAAQFEHLQCLVDALGIPRAVEAQDGSGECHIWLTARLRLAATRMEALRLAADPVSPPSPPTDICWCRKNPCVCQPEHDAACESELTSHGYTPCRCNWRRAMSAASPSVPPAVSPPSPTLAEHTIDVGDQIRFSAVLLDEMTKEDYPAMRLVEIRRAVDGSKVLVLQSAASPSVPVEKGGE
jgi:hypothetical protein